MKNITVSVDNEVYRQARIWAAQNGTSVSKIVARFLKTLPHRKLPAQRPWSLRPWQLRCHPRPPNAQNAHRETASRA